MRSAAVAAAAVVAGFLVTAAPAAAAPPPAAPAPTKVTIRVSDGVDQVRDRSSVAYVATVVNDGDTPITGRLVLEVPAFVHYREAPAAKVLRHDASWTIRVTAHSTASRRVTVRIGAIPRSRLRVTSLASLFVGPATATPLVRSADSDRIAGVTDPVATPLPQSPSRRRSVASVAAGRHDAASTTWAVVALPVAGAIGLAVLGGLVGWRRRSNTTEPTGA